MGSDLFEILQKLKQSSSLVIYDSHMHPYDVMGIVNPNKNVSKIKPANYGKVSLAELLKLGKIVNLILEVIFRLSPVIVESSIKSMYATSGVSSVLEEMDYAGIDMGVLVPVEPWVSTKRIYENFQNKRFIVLGSVDVHNTPLEKLESNLNKLLDFKVKGLKLHPNLQGFYPQPKDNTPEVKEKLNIIYKFIQSNNLYALFHGGYTRFTKLDESSPGRQKSSSLRGSNYALIENFCDTSGRSELFENYSFPVVIAHLGNYALIKPNFKIFKIIINKFQNVYFDTAGVSPDLIRRGIEVSGSQRIIFGSDAQYYNLFKSVDFCLDAISKARVNENKEDMILNIFGNNFRKLIDA